MSGEKDFARSLSQFLALHTEQSPHYLNSLITSFLHNEFPSLELSAKDVIKDLLKADLEDHHDIPNFLQNYLNSCLAQPVWSPQAIYIASLYMRRRSGDRFVTWRERQRMMAELDGELIRGTELGFRHLLYSQGAGAVFRWRGLPCFKSVYDLAIYAMLIDELRPGTIVELGSGSGASALLFADLCACTGLQTQIISIDKIPAAISDPRISFIHSECARWLEETAKSKSGFRRPVLMIEDFHDDVTGFFANMDAILEADDYLVIEDSSPKQEQIAKAIADRPYLVDTKYTDFFGFNCASAINSLFVKTVDTHVPQSRTRQERQRLREQDRAWRQLSLREADVVPRNI